MGKNVSFSAIIVCFVYLFTATDVIQATLENVDMASNLSLVKMYDYQANINVAIDSNAACYS